LPPIPTLRCKGYCFRKESPLSDALELRPTKLTSRFEVLRPLAVGGMGAVSVAFDQVQGDTCCIKSIPVGSDPVIIQRFVAEASVLVALRSPHVVPLRAYGVDDEIIWYAMDRMTGSLYSRRKSKAPIEPMLAADWMVQALAGLEALHRRGVVHRDVKLANLLLDNAGTVMVADLGLARHPQGSVPYRTQGDRGLGTPDYAAPELFRDAANADLRADLFGIAVCFFELVTAQAPARFVLHPIEPSVLDHVPEAFVDTLRIIGAPRPEHRYASASAVAEALCRAADNYADEKGLERQGNQWMHRFEKAAPPLGMKAWFDARLWHWGLR
jgi:serine/threonine protein kinase